MASNQNLPADLLPLGSLVGVDRGDGLRHTKAAKFAPSDMHDWVFFNHGAFFQAGLFEEKTDPVGDWFSQQDHSVDILRQAYRAPIFQGLDACTIDNRVPWNRILCGVRREYWPSLLEFLAGIVVRDWKKRRVGMAYHAYIDILDPSFVDQYGTLDPRVPSLRCCVFCVNATESRYEFVRELPIVRQPRLVQLPPHKLMEEITAKAMADDLEPIVLRQNPAHEEFLRDYRRATEDGMKVEAPKRADRLLLPE
jgi:hypothetical protein